MFRWPSKQSLSRSQSKSSLKRQLPTLRPHRGKRPFDRSHDSLKKGSAAALDSESEESGYGETYYTMHASSFDNDAFDSVIETTMPGTPEQNHYSDNDSTVSYITGEFPSANPDDLRDATSQTHGNARTQTHSGLWNGSQRDISTQMPRAMETQTDGFSRYINRSTQSLQSIGAQTRRSNGSRTDLLKSILMEVKTMKSQRGLTSPSDNSQSPYGSDTSLKKGMLVDILTDVRTLKENGAHGETGTQTETEQSTQTGPRLFPEADPVRNARHGRLRELMDDVKELKSGNANSVAASPVADYRSQQTSAMGDPLEQSPLSNTVTPNRSSPIRFGVTQPHATQDFQLPNSSITPNYGNIEYPGQRITMNDIHNINDRIQRLNNYQLPPRRTLPQPPPPPPPPPQFIVPVYASPPPRRVTFREFPRSFEDENDGFLSDESEYDGGIAPRRRRRRHTPTLERYGIEDALTEACSAAKQLRKMSQKMKDSLRDEFLHR